MSAGRVTNAHGDELAYEYAPGIEPLVVFLNGFRSDMAGRKVAFIRTFCAVHGFGSLTLTIPGTGSRRGHLPTAALETGWRMRRPSSQV